jgi:hypothetical protein
MIELSVKIDDNPKGSFIRSEIEYMSHAESAKARGKTLNLHEGIS